MQDGMQFELSSSASESSALFTPEDGWDGCSDVISGFTHSGIISSIPSWFDMSSRFLFTYDSNSWLLE
jgi:hypothetical protein